MFGQIEKGRALYPKLVEPCSTLLLIWDGASIRSSGLQCKSPEMITWSVWILGVMTSCCFATVLVEGLRQVFEMKMPFL